MAAAGRLGVTGLNPMQRRMAELGVGAGRILLLSPTGTGKTLAFALPLLKALKPSSGRLQALIIAPSRELVLQITGVLRTLSGGEYRTVALYGGHKVEDEVNELRTPPDIVVATPGRLLDQIQRRNLDVIPCRIVVLDEFDKSLELGFADDMRKIFAHLKNVSRLWLTSATPSATLPDFIGDAEIKTLNYLGETGKVQTRMHTLRVNCEGRDKLEDLKALLNTLSRDEPLGRTIVFVNHRESAERVADYLQKQGVSAVLYHGALDQTAREKAVALFTSGARNTLVSTDLAARGLDIPEVENIIHYHLPLTPETYTHRNGRTARVQAQGNIYIMTAPDETLPEYIRPEADFPIDYSAKGNTATGLTVLYINAGRKDKLSKGDILGWLTKECDVPSADVGRINVGDHYALVTLPQAQAHAITSQGQNHRIKGTTRRVTPVK